MLIIQVRNDGGWNQSDSSKSSEKWLDFGQVLKEELIRFDDVK